MSRLEQKFTDTYQEYQRYAITAAKELGYSSKYIAQLINATSSEEISRIMYTARTKEWENGKLNKWDKNN